MVGIPPSNAGGAGLIVGWGAKILHASWPNTQNRKDRNNIVTNSVRLFKMVHIKKILKKNNNWTDNEQIQCIVTERKLLGFR